MKTGGIIKNPISGMVETGKDAWVTKRRVVSDHFCRTRFVEGDSGKQLHL